MSAFIDIVLPVFALLGVGFAAARLGWFDETATKALARFVFQFALPVMLFVSMAEQGGPSGFAPTYLLAYFIAVFIVAAAAVVAAKILGRGSRAARVSVGFSASYGNVVLLGIPLVLTALGEQATLPLFVLVSFHGPIMMTTITILLERDNEQNKATNVLIGAGKGLLSNPILIGLVSGVAFGWSGLTLPAPIQSSGELLGSAGLPTALFAMGASLAGYRIQGALSVALVIVGLKTMLQPMLVWLLADYVLQIERLWADVAILLAATPTGVNAYLFAARYRAGEPEAATAILISTAFSLLTVSVILALRFG